MFEAIYKIFTMPADFRDTIVEWKSKRFSNEKIKPPITANNRLPARLVLQNNSRIREHFKEPA